MLSPAETPSERSKIVLVTGASGFIGRRVLPGLLQHGFEVHAVSRQPPRDAEGVRWHTLDLADHSGVDRLLRTLFPTHLLHLAWETTHGSYYTAPQNVQCLRDSLNLVQSFVRSGGRRIVSAGTSAEYDLNAGSDFIEGVTPLKPNGLYGLCKKALFEVIAQYATQSGVDHAWGRIFFCYGPGEHPSRLVPTILRQLSRGQRVPFQEGRTVRDYVHVDDVADAFIALTDSHYVGPINIGSGEPVALRAFVSKLAEASGRPDGIQFGALATPWYEPPRVVADTTRIRHDVGWRPRRSLDEGIRETVAWWRDQWSATP